jgi:hypothetical protein
MGAHNQLDPYYENKEEYYVEYSPDENIQSIEAELAKVKNNSEIILETLFFRRKRKTKKLKNTTKNSQRG